MFLDPPITDEPALKAEIKKKINNWNKMLNADPKNKVRVSKAKEHLNSGLSNLQSLADKARNEKLQALRNDIKKAGRVGGINEIKLKKLKSTYRTFFSEGTIEKECGGAMAASDGQPPLPKFTPPTCPDSFVCDKKISFKEMENLAGDLALIDGKPKNLYELLKGSSSDSIEKLSALAKEASTRAVKMPKTNAQADPLNRLAGKCINFFKDVQNKRNYDIALKRFPFDNLCEEELHWNIDKESGVPWEIYQEAIHKTAQLGFVQGESGWLVYEYYCVINKCPDPIPEADKPTQFTPTNQPRPDWIETITKNTGQFLGQFSVGVKQWYHKARQAKPKPPKSPEPPPPEQNPFAAPQPTSTLPKPPEPSTPVGQSPFSAPMPPASPKEVPHGAVPENLQKTLDGLRKKFSQQKNPSTIYLNGLFEELDSMFVQYQTAPTESLRNLKNLRAEVAEKLGDLIYAEGYLVSAKQCYRAVLDSMPQHAKAGSRLRIIDEMKDSLYRQVRSALSEKNYLACKQGIAELHAKFATDPETEDFVRQIENQLLDVSVSKEYVQQLITENRWYTLVCLLEGTDQPSYREVLRKAKKRVNEATKNFPTIRSTLHRGRVEKVRQQLLQIRNFITDLPEYDAFINEAKQFQNIVKNLNVEFQALIDRRRLIKGENKLRQFLSEYPKYLHGLAGYAQYFGNGVIHFQNGLRFSLFTILGSILFLIIFLVVCQVVPTSGHIDTKEIVVAIGLGFLLTKVILSFVIRFLYVITKTPFSPGGFGWFGTVMLFVLASLTGCLVFIPDITLKMATFLVTLESDSPTAEINRETLAGIFLFIATWFFVYIIHIYIFSFFNRCMEDEKSQPTYPLLGVVIFPLGLLAAGQVSVPTDLLLWGSVIAFWGFTALVAYLHLRKEMSAFSTVSMADYWQRNALLNVYRDTDFGRPLLLTDWYQKALDVAMQATEQSVASQIKNNP